MSAVAVIAHRGQLGEVKSIDTTDRGIDKKNQVSAGHIQGVFDLQLKVGLNFNCGQIEMLFDKFQQQRPQGVVAPADIAVTEYQKRFNVGCRHVKPPG